MPTSVRTWHAPEQDDDDRDEQDELESRQPPRSQVVLTMSSEQGRWWLTLLGTEPRRNRLTPVMPRLPIDEQVVARRSAASIECADGSASTTSVSIATPASA